MCLHCIRSHRARWCWLGRGRCPPPLRHWGRGRRGWPGRRRTPASRSGPLAASTPAPRPQARTEAGEPWRDFTFCNNVKPLVQTVDKMSGLLEYLWDATHGISDNLSMWAQQIIFTCVSKLSLTRPSRRVSWTDHAKRFKGSEEVGQNQYCAFDCLCSI